MGLDAVILVFEMLSFKLIFSLSSFTFIKRLFSYLSHLSVSNQALPDSQAKDSAVSATTWDEKPHSPTT